MPLTWYCILALTLTYGAYVAEVYRAGIESIHWSQVAAARSLGLSYLADAALRHRAAGGAPDHRAAAQRLHRAAEGHGAGAGRSASSTPSTSRGSSPPTPSTCRRSPSSPSCSSSSPFRRRASSTSCIERDNAPHPGRRLIWPSSRSGRSTSSSGRSQVLRGAQSRRQRASGRLPDRPVGLRQVHAAALHQRARADPGRRDPARRRPRIGPGRRCQPAAPRGRHRVPELQPVPAHDACWRT